MIAALIGGAVALIPLGLALGCSPALYALTLRALVRGKGAARIVTLIAIGLLAGDLLELGIFRLFDPEALIALLKGDVHALLIKRSVNFTAAFLLLVIGVVMLLRKPRAPHGTASAGSGVASARGSEPHADHAVPDSTWGLLATGAAGSIGATNVVSAYLAGRIIASAGHGVVGELILVAVLAAVIVGPYFAAVKAWKRWPVLGERADDLTARLARIDRRPIAIVLAFGGAGVLVILGILGR